MDDLRAKYLGAVASAAEEATLEEVRLAALGKKGEPVLNFVTVLQRLVFKILAGIMWLAPIGAFGAIAGVVGNAGWAAIGSLSLFVLVFYATCVVFIVVIGISVHVGHVVEVVCIGWEMYWPRYTKKQSAVYLRLWQSERAEIFHTASQHIRDRFPHEEGPY